MLDWIIQNVLIRLIKTYQMNECLTFLELYENISEEKEIA